MKTVIISDVHMGSKYFICDLFVAFLKRLPPEASLILNGDTIDRWQKALTPEHQQALALLVSESSRRKVVWVYGNHDEDFKMPDPGKIEFCSDYSIGKRLYIAHGYDFDNVMPYHRMFVRFFRAMHHLRIWLGAESVHVAYYAKKWRFLYNILRKNVIMNAVEHAKENGYAAVTCGHTHFVEDAVVDGIRYINTGSWTEMPIHYVRVDDDTIALKQVDPADPIVD